MSKKLIATLCFAAAGNHFLFAQHLHDSASTKPLDQVIVTATKAPKKATETGKVVTVITRQQIDQSPGKDLAQVLNEQTGLIVNGANSNPGKDKTIFLRGASDKYTLILMDGIPVNDPTQLGGQFDIRLLPLAQIERVEILKGSQSTLYGSSAVAGVINIITRKAATEQTEGYGQFSLGSWNTMKAVAELQKKGEIVEYDLNYQYLSTDGIAEAKDTSGHGNFPKNGYNMQSFQARVGINATDRLKFTPYFRYSENRGTISAAAFTGGQQSYNSSFISTGLNAHYAYGRGTVYANYGYDYTQRYYGAPYPSFFQGRFHSGELFVSHQFSPQWQLVAGVNYQTYSLVKPDTVNNILSPYASLFYRPIEGLNIELGGRYNHNNKYGDNSTYTFNPSYLIRRTVKVFANFSSGFRAPSVNELYGQFGANPALKPEKSNTAEGGVQVFLLDQKLSILADYFDRQIKDVIFYTTDPVTFQGLYVNRDKQHDHGVEGEINYSPIQALNLKLSYTYVTGEVTQKLGTKDTVFNNLVRIPKNNFQFSAGYKITRNFFFSTSLQVTGNRTDLSFDPVTFAQSNVSLGSYALWNAYAEYHLFHNSARIFADVKNITNKKNYYEAYGYSVQGTNLTVGLSFKL